MRRERKYNDEYINMAVEELGSYRLIANEIEQLRYSAETYRQRYADGMLRAQVYDGIRVDGGERNNKMIELVIKWADLTAEAEEKALKAERLLWGIRQKLNKLSLAEKTVLELYYIKGQNTIVIARTMHYSVDGLKNLKYRALKKYNE